MSGKYTNILHLSDTNLSGSPVRISKLINKYSDKFRSRHMVFTPVVEKRVFETDIVSSKISKAEFLDRVEWADIIHYHNRYGRQQVFSRFDLQPPSKPGVIQIHSPRESENFAEEVDSSLPLAIIAQYHPRQWPEASYIVPNVVDILDPQYMPIEKPFPRKPIISYAPSNTNRRGWDDKGYSLVAPHLKRMKLKDEITFQLITDKPHNVAMQLKQAADIGIDEIATGSYHLSSLEYLSMGIPCFANLDGYTRKVVSDLTGCGADLPWVPANRDSFLSQLRFMMENKTWQEEGKKARAWMEKYWSPQVLLNHYEKMYEDILK